MRSFAYLEIMAEVILIAAVHSSSLLIGVNQIFEVYKETKLAEH